MESLRSVYFLKSVAFLPSTSDIQCSIFDIRLLFLPSIFFTVRRAPNVLRPQRILIPDTFSF
jgi:hypothetical protein